MKQGVPLRFLLPALATGGLVFLFVSWRCVSYPALTPRQSAPAPQLVWGDEFDYTGLPDSTRWDYDIGDGCPQLCGWGNNELQVYTARRPENARVENGQLIIEAHRESLQGRAYSSTRLVTRGKADWTYGRIAVRARLPRGRGCWPAIWMLPLKWKYGGWPHSGEIDIMEHVGYEPDSVFSAVHTLAFNGMNGTQQVQSLLLPDAARQFHEYSLRWTPDYLEFMVDGKVFHRFQKQNEQYDHWPFDQPFYLVLNLAVGGNWGGKKGVDESIWPQRFEIDYVRVFDR